MVTYFLTSTGGGESELITRLAPVIPIRPKDMFSAGELIAPGDVCLAAADDVVRAPAGRRAELVQAILMRGGHLALVPPWPEKADVQLLADLAPLKLEDATFGPVAIVDQSLRDACGMKSITVLYRQTILFPASQPAAVTVNRQPVIVRYQHRSTWGLLACTTLLLGSLSSRSDRSHRLALIQGIVKWLAEIRPTVEIDESPRQSAGAYLTADLPLVLLATYLAQQDGIVEIEPLKGALARTRARLALAVQEPEMKPIMAELENMSVLSAAGEGQWILNSGRLAEEINRQHLAGYVRRLR